MDTKKRRWHETSGSNAPTSGLRSAALTDPRLWSGTFGRLGDLGAILGDPTLDVVGVPHLAHAQFVRGLGEVGPRQQLLDTLTAQPAESFTDLGGAHEVMHGRDHKHKTSGHLTSGQWVGRISHVTSGLQPAETQLTVFHGSCVTHEVGWRLTCQELEDLRAHSGHACGICGKYGAGLVNDHDHALGNRAIRGTLCKRCNGQYISRVDSGEYPVAERARAYLANPWHLARQGKALHYDPAVSVSVNGLSDRDRAEVDRLLALSVSPSGGDFSIYRLERTFPNFEHPAIATCVASKDLRPVFRLLRMAYVWKRPNLDISATGPNVPNGLAERDVLLATNRGDLLRRYYPQNLHVIEVTA